MRVVDKCKYPPNNFHYKDDQDDGEKLKKSKDLSRNTQDYYDKQLEMNVTISIVVSQTHCSEHTFVFFQCTAEPDKRDEDERCSSGDDQVNCVEYDRIRGHNVSERVSIH